MTHGHDPRFCACCQPPTPQAPGAIWNRPGLSQIAYRIGTFATFRQALFHAIAETPSIAALTTRESDDHAISLLEAFAALGDVLTFYSERIANEGFLRTATERDSILRLVRLIGYRLQPGLAATAELAFTLDAGAETRLRRGLKVMSVPGQDEKPQTFETLAEVIAHGDLNAVPALAPARAFNAFRQGESRAPLLSRPTILSRGDGLVFFGLSSIEEKTVEAIERRPDGERLHFTPAIQGTSLTPFVARAAKMERRLRFFGFNAPDSHPVYNTDPTVAPQLRWQSQAVSAGLDPADFFYPLDAKYDGLKSGARLLIDAGPTAAPRLRSAVVAETRDEHETQGPIADTVTNVRLFQTLGGRPAVVVRPGGGRHVFGVSGTGAVLTMQPNIGQSWASFGGFIASSETSAVATNAARVDLFARDAAGGLRQAIWNGGAWGGFANLGGVLTSNPKALSLAGGEVAVFARGLDFGLWQRGVLPASINWSPLGGVLTSDPAPVTWGGSRIDVFVRGADRALWQKSRQGGVWSDWTSLGGSLASGPVAASTGLNRLDVVALDDQGAIIHRRWNGSVWSNWRNLGGKADETPTIAASAGDRLDIFVTGRDGQISQIARNGANWSAWATLGGSASSGPAVVTTPGAAHLYIRDNEGVLVANDWIGGSWQGWTRLGAGIGSIPDRRRARIFQVAAEDLVFRPYDHPTEVGGGRIALRFAPNQSASNLNGLGQIKKGRRILLETATRRHLATVSAARAAASIPGDLPDQLLVDFSPPLPLTQEAVTFKGNLAPASHGETQPDEALGNGDATKTFLKASLSRGPLTYLASTTSLAGEAALELRLNGELWQSVPSLYGRNGKERVYTARQNDAGETEVTFGDGVNGARVPSGAVNLVARYRKGLGLEGNVKADQLSLLLERPVGLRAVTNPLPAGGGADPESRDDARRAAPTTVRTFGRAVSLQDFQWIATTSGLVSRAFVTWVWHELERAVHLTVAGPGGERLSPTSMATLKSALDASRDPNRQLFLANLTRVPLVIRAKLLRDPAFEADAVAEAGRAALLALFDFEAVPLGQAIHASSVYAALQGAKGVVAVDLDLFHLKGHETLTPIERAIRAVTVADVQDHIRIFPARPRPANPFLIDRYARAGFEGGDIPVVLAAEQAFIEDPIVDVTLSVVEAL